MRVCAHYIRIKIKKEHNTPRGYFPSVSKHMVYRNSVHQKITIILLLLYGLCKELRGRPAAERRPGGNPCPVISRYL